MNDANLLILDGPQYPTRNPNPAYRGTLRAAPRYFRGLPEDHEANALFLWYIEEGGELGVVHDKMKARKLRDFCNSCGSGTSFEIIEAIEGAAAPVIGGEFLGFDISRAFNSSLLWSGLKTRVPGGPALPVRVLANVINQFFSKELNGNGLFSDIDVASQCRASLIALQALEPNLLEGSELEEFVAVGIFSVK